MFKFIHYSVHAQDLFKCRIGRWVDSVLPSRAAARVCILNCAWGLRVLEQEMKHVRVVASGDAA